MLKCCQNKRQASNRGSCWWRETLKYFHPLTAQGIGFYLVLGDGSTVPCGTGKW